MRYFQLRTESVLKSTSDLCSEKNPTCRATIIAATSRGYQYVCPSVRLSVRSPFLTTFPKSDHHEIAHVYASSKKQRPGIGLKVVLNNYNKTLYMLSCEGTSAKRVSKLMLSIQSSQRPNFFNLWKKRNNIQDQSLSWGILYYFILIYIFSRVVAPYNLQFPSIFLLFIVW